jgi:hypothetical protein
MARRGTAARLDAAARRRLLGRGRRGCDRKLIILDEDGTLALATPTATGLTVHSKVQLLNKVAWTPPSLAGRTLYVRDHTTSSRWISGLGDPMIPVTR